METETKTQAQQKITFDKMTFVIDSQHLDMEWERQSSLCYEACNLAAQSQLFLSDLKRQLEVKKAEVDLDVRRNPAAYGFTSKPTEAAIATAVTLHDEVIETQRKLSDAKYQCDICSAAVTALEHKKKGLDSLVQLRSMNYYSAK